MEMKSITIQYICTNYQVSAYYTYISDSCMVYYAELTTQENAAAAHFNLAQK